MSGPNTARTGNRQDRSGAAFPGRDRAKGERGLKPVKGRKNPEKRQLWPPYPPLANLLPTWGG